MEVVSWDPIAGSSAFFTCSLPTTDTGHTTSNIGSDCWVLQHPAVLEKKELCIKAAKTQEWWESRGLIFKLELQWGNISRLQKEDESETFSAHHISRVVSPFNTTAWLIASRQAARSATKWNTDSHPASIFQTYQLPSCTVTRLII